MTINEQKEILKALRAMLTIATMYDDVTKNHLQEIRHYRDLLSKPENDEILYGKKEWDNEHQTYFRQEVA